MPETDTERNPNGDITLFAKTNYRGSLQPFGIKTDDRRRHMYVIGKTGMGKSTLLENMVIQDIRSGRGLAVVDPHGDLVEKVLKYVPSYRINDVIYLNPADMDFPIAFNILESVDPTHRHLVASGLIAVFKKIWADSWGPRLEHILRNTILALIEYPGSTLLGVTRMLVDKPYRLKVQDQLSDPIVKAFWRDEFSSFNDKFRTEAVSPIQNKIGQFLSSSIIRNIVGQPKSTIDMRETMDTEKILLLNLAKGRIGEDNASLLGAMLITKIQLAAMSRIDIPEPQRRDFFLYVDEFQNFATESFASILSEARKYRLDLIIAHQYIEQLDEKVQAAVFGNVGTMVCFRVGAADAEFLAKEFTPVFEEPDLLNLTKYDMYLKLMIDGVASEPFSATGMPPVGNPDNLEEKVIAVSRERYAKPREVVEDKIARWSGMSETFAATAQAENRASRDDRDEQPRREPQPREDMVVLDRQPVVVAPPAASISLIQAVQPGAPATTTSHPPRTFSPPPSRPQEMRRQSPRPMQNQRPRQPSRPPMREQSSRPMSQPVASKIPAASISLSELRPRPAPMKESQSPAQPPAVSASSISLNELRPRSSEPAKAPPIPSRPQPTPSTVIPPTPKRPQEPTSLQPGQIIHLD